MLDKLNYHLINAKIKKDQALSYMKERLLDEDGASMMEYVVVIAIIVVVALGVINAIGGAITDKGESAAAIIQGVDFNHP